MNSVRIGIYFEPQDGMEWAPEGPGWYIAATGENPLGHEHTVPFEIVPRVRLRPDETEKIAQVLDNFVRNKPLNWSGGLRRVDLTLRDAVLQVNKTGREAVERAVENARIAAQRLSLLQERVKEFENGLNQE